MTILANKLKLSLITTLLMGLMMNSSAMADLCGTGTIIKLTYNDTLELSQIYRQNSLHFKLSDNSEYYINNNGGLANNTIFAALERAVNSAYFSGRNIHVHTRGNIACAGGKDEDQIMIVTHHRG